MTSSPSITVNALDKNTDATFSIQLSNPIDSGSKIEVIIDKNIFTIANSNPTCQQTSGTGISCSMIKNDATESIVSLNEFCSNGSPTCAAGTVMQFKIIGTYKNPSFIIKPTPSIKIKTMTPDLLGTFDEITKNVFVNPILVPNTLTDLQMNYRSDSASSSAYNKLDRYEISFTPFNYFRDNGNTVKIYFP